MNYNWNWNIFFEDAPDGAGTYLDSLFAGLKWTLATAGTGWVIALLIGLVIGTLRTVPNKWLVRLANAYVELFRNIPLIVQFFVWYFVLPGLVPAVKAWVVSLDPTTHQFVTAIVCLGLFTAARISEQVRSGIQALPRGQRMASGKSRLKSGFTLVCTVTLRMKASRQATPSSFSGGTPKYKSRPECFTRLWARLNA